MPEAKKEEVKEEKTVDIDTSGPDVDIKIPEEKDPVELTMEEALILIEKRREYDKNKKSKNKKKK